jgi:hypothetical protein
MVISCSRSGRSTRRHMKHRELDLDPLWRS